MKLKPILIFLPLLVIAMVFIQARQSSPAKISTFSADTVIEFTENAKAIIDKKCFGCHNSNSKNEKGKAKMQWDVITTLSKAKQLAAMEEVLEVMEEGSMPPEKFLANKPEAKLTDKEVNILKAWANTNADRLLK